MRKRARVRMPQRISPKLLYALIQVVFWLALLPGILLFYYSEDLGIWWAVLLFLYMACIFSANIWVLYRREMRDIRNLLGDEQFFQRFRSEWRREKRVRARAAKKRARKDRLPWEPGR